MNSGAAQNVALVVAECCLVRLNNPRQTRHGAEVGGGPLISASSSVVCAFGRRLGDTCGRGQQRVRRRVGSHGFRTTRSMHPVTGSGRQVISSAVDTPEAASDRAASAARRDNGRGVIPTPRVFGLAVPWPSRSRSS